MNWYKKHRVAYAKEVARLMKSSGFWTGFLSTALPSIAALLIGNLAFSPQKVQAFADESKGNPAQFQRLVKQEAQNRGLPNDTVEEIDKQIRDIFQKASENSSPQQPVRNQQQKVRQEKFSIEKLKEDLIRHEGYREWAYDDDTGKQIVPGQKPTGNPTVGIGFNLYRPDARSALRNIGADFNKVINGQQPLSEQQIDSLFNKTIQEAEAIARRFCKNFDNLTADAQEILVNMAFNLGEPRLSKFKNLKKWLEQGNYSKAALSMQNSKWARQTKSRATELIQRMKQIS